MPFVSGLDLGQASDFSAFCIVELTPVKHPTRLNSMAWMHAVRHLKRWPLNTGYPAIVDEVASILADRLPGFPLAVDQTGVGRAVVDIFRGRALKARLMPVTITGGQSHTKDADGWKVPKKELVGVLQALLQTRRLIVAPRLKEADILRRELGNFRVKITAAAHETFGVWREGQHDDLVLAVALACWFGERQVVGDMSKAISVDPGMTFPQF